MISVTVKMGCGDRKSSDISDDMISSVTMAKIRGRQELLNFLVIAMKRSLSLPHTPTIDLGLSPPMNIAKLDIYGEHEIQSFSIEITPEGIFDQVEVYQTGGHLLEGNCNG